MIDRVLTKFYDEPPVNRREIMRYSGCRSYDGQVESLVEECLSECRGVFSFKVCYREFAVNILGDLINIGFSEIPSLSLKKNLSDCRKIIAFAATVGIGIDRLITRYSHSDSVKAVIMQAIGAERIESLCNVFCEDIKNRAREEGLYTRPRFSPGYGDFPLEKQRDFFSVLDCYRKIGVSLNDSLLMTPTKSVTAIIGLSDKACRGGDKCSYCDNHNCGYRHKEE